MSTVSDYYEKLWTYKTKGGTPAVQHYGAFDRIRNVLFDPTKHSRHDVARELLHGVSGRLLDVGCWGGDSLVAMGALEQFKEVYGVDLIEESLAKAREKGIKAQYCDLNATQLPCDDNFFDAVTCLAVIGQTFDPFFVFSEINRVLKPQGVLVLNVPNVASLTNRFRLLFGTAPVTSRDPGWDGGQLHHFTARNTAEALEAKGFEVAELRATGGGHWLRKLRPSLLSGTLMFKAIKR